MCLRVLQLHELLNANLPAFVRSTHVDALSLAHSRKFFMVMQTLAEVSERSSLVLQMASFFKVLAQPVLLRCKFVLHFFHFGSFSIEPGFFASQPSKPAKQASKQGSSSNSNSNTKSNSKGYNKSNSSKLTRHGSCDSKRRAVAIVIVHNSTRNSQVLVMATRM